MPGLVLERHTHTWKKAMISQISCTKMLPGTDITSKGVFLVELSKRCQKHGRLFTVVRVAVLISHIQSIAKLSLILKEQEVQLKLHCQELGESCRHKTCMAILIGHAVSLVVVIKEKTKALMKRSEG